jgi:hypothetical protein
MAMGEHPTAVRLARFPAEYGARGGPDDEPLAWDDVEERLRNAPNYWVVTVTPEGRPHARPVDGVWVDGALCFGGSHEARWARNLAARPEVAVHLAGDDDIVILEGTAERVTEPEHPLSAASMGASRAKYPQYGSSEDDPFLPFWAFRPAAVYAWSLSSFPKRATRWAFEG